MMKTRAARLRELISNRCIAMPGVPNAAFARLVQRAGFEALYVSGAGLANMTAGLPDIGLLTLTEVARLGGWIAGAVTIPAVIDADTGFGGPENVARTVREFETAGLAGCHIEDQEFPKRCGHLAGKTVVTTEEMVEKIKIAASVRRDRDFIIIARTDARSVEDFPATVQRSERYVDAGADAIFPEALQTADEFRLFAKELHVPLLANMTEFGKSPLLEFSQLEDFGFRMVIYPQSALRVALKCAGEFYIGLKEESHQANWLNRMQTRQELYELLDYDPAAEHWHGYHL